jgi:LPPG:FO 2-phospho-L-lactate transferase
MSDDAVRTRVRTDDRWLSFQEYLVKEGARPDVVGVEYVGAEYAAVGPDALDAIRTADAIIVCPSNPITSIGPILALPAMRAALQETKSRKVAVSPIVHGEAVSGPAARLMRACGLPASAAGVAQAYTPWLDVLVLDRGDAGESQTVRDTGAEPILADLIMADHASSVALAQRVLEAIA